MTITSGEKMSTQKKSLDFSGWRAGALLGAVTALLVLVTNIGALVGTIHGKGANEDGRIALYEGDCSKVRQLNTGIHFLINILSTLLLGASNYCMQCASAPTCREADKAHEEKYWLDIGVLSWRNLRRISTFRLAVWIILATSSLPLHLFYNSAIFASISSPIHNVYTVPEVYLDPAVSLPDQELLDMHLQYGTETERYSWIFRNRHRMRDFERLSPLECIEAFGQHFQTKRINVLLVTGEGLELQLNQETSFDWQYRSVPEITDGDDQFPWICGSLHLERFDLCENHLTEIKANTTSWAPYGETVDYCLSESTPEVCKLHASLHIAIIVIIMNAIKVFTIGLLLFGMKAIPLLTIGDAIASFLRNPDEHTKGICLLEKEDVLRKVELGTIAMKTYTGIIHRRKRAVTPRRWRILLALLFVAFVTVLALLIWALTGIAHAGYGSPTAGLIARLGLGATDPRTIIKYWSVPSEGVTGIMSNVLVANTPQLLFSMIYYFYNSTITAMTMSAEWSQLAKHRKGLRVSCSPEGDQRSTYFLELPYRYSIPTLLMSGVMHWLIGQALFIIELEVSAVTSVSDIVDSWSSVSMSCGYSPLAMILVLAVTTTMVAFVIGLGYRKVRSPMPIAGSCSLAIAAACHVQPSGSSQHVDPTMTVQWGVTNDDEEDSWHCGISDRPVSSPLIGHVYR